MAEDKDRVFAVIGLGQFGVHLATALAEKGFSVIAIDNDQNALDLVKGRVAQALLIDAEEESFTIRAPLDDVDVALVALSQFEVAILAVLYLKQVGVPYIVARAETTIHAHALTKVGADQIINVEEESGKRLAHQLASPHILDVIRLSNAVMLAEVVANKALVGKELRELDLRKQYGINIVAIRRIHLLVSEEGLPTQGEEILLPGPEDKIEASDILIVVGSTSAMDRFKNE
ncbi:potassium channel family protein [Entomospira culicis]|uniref:TrkA family potassium uptake protein n=1 Tax=Entomospira culicis TaxID=2719989 RepID=A0A968KYV1_9SPIO|nr:TrkA family potassium uptake protein [Entomospira culicis]NIZ18460.1 TrkA family potassium uptake protein [Entomospira culicis]NIZ68676.1 TrkA family potassium uptake protein [Entomospira culicis]WDI37275.1 TrkA family potassium uptake protein [Entomospira culicis]WDI38904.1 TrkA family potassium uptake protein [Entomospira culicis]